MDSRTFYVNGYIRTAIQTRLTYALCTEFITQILNGTVTNFSIANFFQEDSDYIVKMTYFPFRTDLFITAQYTTDNYVDVGNKVATLSDKTKEIITYASYIDFFGFDVTRIHNNFLDFAPYTKIKIFIPFFPIVELPPEKVYGRYLKGYISVDFISGKATIYIYSNASSTAPDDFLIETVSANLGIDIPIGKSNEEEQQRNKVLIAIDSAVGFGGLAIGGKSGNALASVGALGMLGKTIKSTLNNNVDHLTSYMGGLGNRDMLPIAKEPMLIIETPKGERFPNRSIKGGVCRKNLTLSSVTGYTEIGEINFNPSGYEIYDDEISEIVDLLHSGVIL